MDIDMAALRQLEADKDIPIAVVIEALEDALLNAYEKTEKQVPGGRVTIDRKSGAVHVFAPELNEDGEKVGEDDDTPTDFGRIAAATARQIVMQRLREAEDDQKYGHFAAIEGDILLGVVQQDRHSPTVRVDLGKVEAILPQAEQVPGEDYSHGRRLRVYVVAVRRELRGLQIGRVPHAPGTGREAVQARGAGDRARHRRDQVDRARSRASYEARGPQHQPRRVRERRLHRSDGAARTGGHA